jgi:hypothetical protein
MLSLEAVTHAPVDAGFQAGLEVPGGFRLFAGYGWVPEPYLDAIVEGATLASDADPTVRTAVGRAFERGRVWRLLAGVRPFRKLGLHLDGGYANVRLNGSLVAAELAPLAGLPPERFGSAGYDIESTLHMWHVVLGYQFSVARHLVFGLGLGVMGTIDADTQARPTFGSTGSAGVDRQLTSQATAAVDQQLETYGFLPTLTLRLGFDLI